MDTKVKRKIVIVEIPARIMGDDRMGEEIYRK
jgi:hypothetical protein